MITYQAINLKVFEKIPPNIKSLLDVGCGAGNLGQAIKLSNHSCYIEGLTYSTEEKLLAEKYLDKVSCVDINKELPVFNQTFDCIVFSHILEHTYFPDKILLYFAQYLRPDGIIIIALPNVLFFKQRLTFLKGHFKYSPTGGLMDDTHFRFFDWETVDDLLDKSNLKCISKFADGNFPLPVVRQLFPTIAHKIDLFFVKKFPGLFGFQFILIAQLNK